MGMFQVGEFILASGKKSNFKIDCDILTVDDWASLAEFVVPSLPRFGGVIGIPSGGWKFAEALYKHRTAYAPIILLVDDVWTTGKSMKVYVPQDTEWHGVVLFSRAETVPHNVTVLFHLNHKLLLPSTTG